MPDVVVVGAGIVGAAIAHECARRGVAVTLVDHSLPASGATGASFAWIGVHGDVPPAAAGLHAAALDAYRELELQVPGVQVRWSGSLTWPGAATSTPAPGAQPDVRVVDAAGAGRLEPNLRRPPAAAVHTASDAAVDPVAVTEALVRAAREHGAEVRLGVTTTALTRSTATGRVVGVETSAGPLPADTVIVAAGAGVPVLCAPLGVHVPVAPSPALLVRFDAPDDVVRTLVASPLVEVRQGRSGELLASVGYDGQSTRGELEQAGQQVLARIRETFTGADGVRLRSVEVGVRPMPVDAAPVVGPLPGAPGAYVAVMHSAVSLAPAVARCVAQEVVTGQESADLRGCRPERFGSVRRQEARALP